jgi:hypothetical protein
MLKSIQSKIGQFSNVLFWGINAKHTTSFFWFVTGVFIRGNGIKGNHAGIAPGGVSIQWELGIGDW